MFTFSSQHPWQANEAVQQILVFPSAEMEELFKREMLDRFDKIIARNAYAGTDPTYETRVRNDLSDSNAGAVYKLRAVLNSDKKWIPVIRCGITGGLLWEDYCVYDTAETALLVCFNQLKSSIMKTPVPASLLVSPMA